MPFLGHRRLCTRPAYAKRISTWIHENEGNKPNKQLKAAATWTRTLGRTLGALPVRDVSRRPSPTAHAYHDHTMHPFIHASRQRRRSRPLPLLMMRLCRLPCTSRVLEDVKIRRRNISESPIRMIFRLFQRHQPRFGITLKLQE